MYRIGSVTKPLTASAVM
ncbi:hypothetical protein [Paenibacillus sp. RC84]